MAKGDCFKQEFKQEQDPQTGRTVIRLTSEGTVNHHPYFYNRILTRDGRSLLYGSNRDGNRNLYLLDIENGNTVQLTDGTDIQDFSPYLTKDDTAVYYAKANGILRMELESLTEDWVYRPPDGWKFGSFGLSPDDRCILINEMWQADVIQSPGDWSSFEAQWSKGPRCRLVYLNLETGKPHSVLEEPSTWLGHPQIRPGHNQELLFCHEGPGHLIDARLWLVDADGSRLRCAKEREPDEAVTTHEYWLPDGSQFAFMHRKINGDTTIRLINPDTLKETVFMPCSHYCHFISNEDNTLMAGDGQPPKDPCLFLVDVKARRESMLCVHGSSFSSYGNTQDCHPHPSFTHDSTAVIFTSDKDGAPNIYKVIL